MFISENLTRLSNDRDNIGDAITDVCSILIFVSK